MINKETYMSWNFDSYIVIYSYLNDWSVTYPNIIIIIIIISIL